MPAATAFLTARQSGSVRQDSVESAARLTLSTRMPYSRPWKITQSMPISASATSPTPWSFSTRTSKREAPGATAVVSTAPETARPAASEATIVPWPSGSGMAAPLASICASSASSPALPGKICLLKS